MAKRKPHYYEGRVHVEEPGKSLVPKTDLESRLIEACLEERRAWLRWETTGNGGAAWKRATDARIRLASELLAEREKGGKG